MPGSMTVRLRPSPNVNDRRTAVSMLVLHYTGMRDVGVALERLVDPSSGVSAHWLVDEDGEITSLVPEARRAWHAGAACWQGIRDVNSASVGIEIVNPGHAGGLPPFPGRQMDAVAALSRDVLARHGIRQRHVLGHSDVAPLRKQDPGELFDWRLAGEPGRRAVAAAAATGRDIPGRGGQGLFRHAPAGTPGRFRIRRRAGRHLRRRDGCRRHRLPAPLSPGAGRRRGGRRDRGPSSRRSSMPHVDPVVPARYLFGTGIRRTDGRSCLFGKGGKSGLHGNMAPRVTPGGGDPRESATESRPPPAVAPAARVKGCGKSAPRLRHRRRHGKPRQEQDRVGAARGVTRPVSGPRRPG